MRPSDLPPDGLPDAPVAKYRTIWISDIHLGTAGCKAEYLLDFLKHNEPDALFLVGDIIDAWQLKRGWYWRQAHNDVVQKLSRKARKGARVIYIPGNHDDPLREFFGLMFGGIEVVGEAVHITADGRRLLVIHGDVFDGVIQHAKWLAYLGDSLYAVILKMNHWFNHVGVKWGFPYCSLSQYLKHKAKKAVSFICDFEEALANEALRRGLDGVVCGHIHNAEIRDIGGILYCNDGDWVESLTALVETHEGALSIVEWNRIFEDEQYAQDERHSHAARGALAPVSR